MAVRNHRAHINMLGNHIIQALIDPQASDPGSPSEGQIWYNSTTERLMIRLNAANAIIATMNDVTAGSITGALWDAQSVVTATVDDTPVAVVIPEGAVLGRIAGGNIGAVTAAQLKTMLTIPAGTVATTTDITNAINNLVDTAPGTLDTLNELAAALGDDPAFATTITNSLATKVGTYTANIGGATTITLTHNLGNADPLVQARAVSDDVPEVLDWAPTDSNNVDVYFNTAPGAASIRVTVHG